MIDIVPASGIEFESFGPTESAADEPGVGAGKSVAAVGVAAVGATGAGGFAASAPLGSGSAARAREAEARVKPTAAMKRTSRDGAEVMRMLDLSGLIRSLWDVCEKDGNQAIERAVSVRSWQQRSWPFVR